MNITLNESKSPAFTSVQNKDGDVKPGPVQIIIADSEAIFRVGMAKIFALENDLEVVAQTENLPQTLTMISTFQRTSFCLRLGYRQHRLRQSAKLRAERYPERR